VIARLPEFIIGGRTATLTCDAVDFLLYVREDSSGLDKRPGTAELLGWLSAMAKLGAKPSVPLRDQFELAERAFPTLAKISGDQHRMRELLRIWKDERNKI
jgi:hypothetical protein